jgi:hypothetical protein
VTAAETLGTVRTSYFLAIDDAFSVEIGLELGGGFTLVTGSAPDGAGGFWLYGSQGPTLAESRGWLAHVTGVGAVTLQRTFGGDRELQPGGVVVIDGGVRVVATGPESVVVVLDFDDDADLIAARSFDDPEVSPGLVRGAFAADGGGLAFAAANAALGIFTVAELDADLAVASCSSSTIGVPVDIASILTGNGTATITTGDLTLTGITPFSLTPTDVAPSASMETPIDVCAAN